MRFTAAFILLLAFTAQTFRQQFIMFGYYVNTTAFAKNCENKAKPKLQCNGKCQAMKKIKEEEKKDGHFPVRMNDGKIETLSSKSFFPSVQVPELAIHSKEYRQHSPGNVTDRSSDCFHPPQA